MSLDELNEKEDDIDEEEERIFEEYRLVYNNLKTTLPDALMFIFYVREDKTPKDPATAAVVHCCRAFGSNQKYVKLKFGFSS